MNYMWLQLFRVKFTYTLNLNHFSLDISEKPHSTLPYLCCKLNGTEGRQIDLINDVKA